MTKIPQSVLTDLQEAGLSKTEAINLAREKYAAIKETLSPEDIEYLGKSLLLSVSPTSGSANDTFKFTVKGFNPKHTVVLKLDVRWGRDPEMGTFTDAQCSVKGGDIHAYGTRGLLRKIAGAASPTYRGVAYAQEKIRWWFDKKSNRVTVTVSKTIPLIGGMASGIPGMEHGASLRDLMPAPPPLPPLPYFFVRKIMERFRRK